MRYRAYLLFGFMVATFWVLMADLPSFAVRTPLQVDQARVQTEGRARLRAMERRISAEMMDRYGAMLHEQLPEEEGLLLHVDDGLTVRHRDQLQGTVEALRAETRAHTGPMRLGVFMIDERQTDLLGNLEPATYAGVRDGVPFCFRVLPKWPNSRRSSFTGGQTDQRGLLYSLGACAWVASLGLPGPEIARWWNGLGGAPGLLVHQSDFAATRIQFFSRGRDGAPATSGQACIDGDRVACASAFHTDWTPHEGFLDANGEAPFLLKLDNTSRNRWSQVSLGQSGLSALEQQFGTDALRDFWTSTEAPAVAFEAAFGMNAGDWVYERRGEEWKQFHAGPAPDGLDVFFALCFAGMGLWFATGWMRRRTVG